MNTWSPSVASEEASVQAVALIQRFGSALNLNVHFHMLFLDGVYTTTPWGKSRFHRTHAPSQQLSVLIGRGVAVILPILMALL
jgi:hypothetical protein